jgi:dimethylglycine dehydrogenase
MTALFAGSIYTYLQAEEETDLSVDFHETGSLRLAATERELFRVYALRYAKLGIPFHIRTPDEVAALPPYWISAQSMAAGARKLGVAFKSQSPVTALHKDGDHWVLETPDGQVRAQHVVVATSLWAREILEPLGLYIPIYPMQHHEIITENLPEAAALSTALPSMRDSWVSCNVREERNGLLIGIYEKEPEFWTLDGSPPDFKEDLLPPNLDPLMLHL